MDEFKTVKFVAGAEQGIFFDVLADREVQVKTFDDKDLDSKEALREQIKLGRQMVDFLLDTAREAERELDQTEAEPND